MPYASIVVITQGSLHMVLTQKQNTAEWFGLTIPEARDHAESLLMLRAGRAVAWLEDEILLAGVRSTVPDPAALVFLPEAAQTDDEYGLMLRRYNPESKALVDDTLRAERASGALNRLYESAFLNPIPPKGLNLDFPMSEALWVT